MMITKKKIIATICIVITLAVVAVVAIQIHGHIMQQREEEREHFRQKLIYANMMDFDNNFVLHRHTYTELDLDRFTIILVHSEDEAMALSDEEDVFIAWPSILSQGMLDAMNRDINNRILTLRGQGREIDMERFNLTYPITPEDLVSNWENVHDLIISENLDEFILSLLILALGTHGEEDFRNRQRQWFLFANRLDMLNEFLEDKDMSEFSLVLPVTEQDILNDAIYVWEMMDTLLTFDEMSMIFNEPIAHLNLFE